MIRDSKTTGIVIKTENSREKDKLLSILTPDEGVIRVLVYGAQKSVKSIKASLYSEGMFSLYKKKDGDIYTLKDLDIIALHEYISEDLDKIAAAALFSELMIKSRTSEVNLYRLYIDAIDSLEREDYQKVVISFSIKFLSFSGLIGDFKHCPSCLREYKADEVLGFSPILSTAVCHDCDKLEGQMILPPSARRYLERVLSIPMLDSFALNLSKEQLYRIYRYVLRTLERCFPSSLDTLSSGLLVW